jgi:putative transposase
MRHNPEKSWRRIRGAAQIQPLLDGVPFEDGIPVQDNPPGQQKLAA